MTTWETKIALAFTSRYANARYRAERFGGANADNAPVSLRLRSISIFPDFDAADSAEKHAYTEAARAMEKRGLLALKWERRGNSICLKTLHCNDVEKMFEAAGEKNPVRETEEIQRLLEKERPGNGFLRFIAECDGRSGMGRKIDAAAVNDLAILMDRLETRRGITTRALSVELYRDSKRLEYLLEVFVPLAQAARKRGIDAPPLAHLARSFPETVIAGRIMFIYKNGSHRPPLLNDAGLILGLPMQSVKEIGSVKTIDAKDAPSVLTIENKETFFTLADPLSQTLMEKARWDCFVYTGGYPSEAAAAMLRLLAASGFRFYHSGDLDPGGVLILQKIGDIIADSAGGAVPVTPVRMDEAVFDHYLPWARRLSAAALREADAIRPGTRAIPGIAPLLRRIAETRMGVEQEIIDYR